MARPKGRLAAKGFLRIPDRPERRYRDPQGRDVSYREAFERATGRTLEAASRKGKFERTLSVARRIRDAAADGELSRLKVLDVDREKLLGHRTLKSLMRGHTFRSALARGTAYGRAGIGAPVERRTTYGKLLAVLHDDIPHRGPSQSEADRVLERREFLSPASYRRRFGPDSRKAHLLVAMGLRDPDARYDVGETP